MNRLAHSINGNTIDQAWINMTVIFGLLTMFLGQTLRWNVLKRAKRIKEIITEGHVQSVTDNTNGDLKGQYYPPDIAI